MATQEEMQKFYEQTVNFCKSFNPRLTDKEVEDGALKITRKKFGISNFRPTKKKE